MKQLEQRYIDWQKRTLDMLKVGGIWGASHFTLKKVSENEVKFIMDDQDPENELVRRYIVAAGYKVVS
jgi:hypothetical protein